MRPLALLLQVVHSRRLHVFVRTAGLRVGHPRADDHHHATRVQYIAGDVESADQLWVNLLSRCATAVVQCALPVKIPLAAGALHSDR